MAVSETVTKFIQLVRLCPSLVPKEEERVKRLMDVLRLEIALAIDNVSKSPTTMVDCIARAIRTKYRQAHMKEDRAQF